MISLAREVGTFIPTAAQHELLRAALLDDRDEVARALARWKAAVALDRLDLGSRRLLSPLYANLKRLAIDDELLPRLKATYRQTWLSNQRILQRGAGAVRTMREQGIPVLLIKGAALLATVYDDAGLRPMDDIDLVVPRADFPRAALALAGIGWKLHPDAADPEAHLHFHHAVCLRNEEQAEIDLHWATTYGVFDRRGEEEFWRTTGEAMIGGERVRVLAAPDQLLQLCAHANQRNDEVAPIRWAADAWFLLRRSPVPFDWSRLIELARMRSLSLTQLRALQYLRDGLGAAVPPPALQALREGVRMREHLALRLRMAGRPVQRWYAAWIWIRLVFLDGLRGVPRRLALLRRYLRSSFRVPPEVSLFRFVVRKILHGPGSA